MNSEITAQLYEAASLMLVGMGFVFAFLTLLIGGVKSIELFCRRFAGPVAAPDQRTPRPKPAAASRQDASPDPATVAAISAAIHLHRHSNK
ncbi:OadG family protein [Salinimonas marina]|uniref:Probable oxaloacetate decarboxylase gamma chain n=1 Tax=Salinimonas marina TaxID=2785918 RepID=A0A7S9HCA5_9ALTE|nr:OadG family transporter subunit [Salinimonas marina]QPG04909.1 OadG family protein [Salinimonas marina]